MNKLRRDYGFPNWDWDFDSIFKTITTYEPASCCKQIHKHTIDENENGYTMEMLVPGMNKENLTIEVEDGNLTIKGEINKDSENSKAKSHTSINKSFIIPDSIDKSEIKAEIVDGILTMSLPFKKKKDKKRSIKIV